MSRIAVVAARWHAEIVDEAVRTFSERIEGRGDVVDVHTVPGSDEIPLRVQRLARCGQHAATLDSLAAL